MSHQINYVLRFVQHFNPADERTFMALERQFAKLEKSHTNFPKGLRLQPLSGREPRHTLIWECKRSSLASVNEALATMSASGDHDRLFQKQAPAMIDSFTEIYEVLDL